jgi:hypothetical protein
MLGVNDTNTYSVLVMEKCSKLTLRVNNSRGGGAGLLLFRR